MKIITIEHAPFEKLGIIEVWAKLRGYEIKTYRPYLGEKLPLDDDSISKFDLLIIMGGPQSILDLDSLTYLRDEITFIQKVIQKDKRIFGVCLGAQLLSVALGGESGQSPSKEIGVFPIDLTDKGEKDALFQGFPRSFLVAHWHGDMPGVPAGAEILAKSEGCPRQIIRFNKKTYGFQCHLEMTYENILGMIKNCQADFVDGKYIQTPEELLAHDYSSINDRLKTFLDRFITL